jgi:pantothenate kinase, type III
MILIDLGNSRVKISDANHLDQFVTLENSAAGPAEVDACIKAMKAGRQVVISSVRKPELNTTLIHGLEQRGYELRFINWRDVKPVLDTDYDSRSSLGIDRQLAVLGAMSLTTSAAIIIDLGTASTIDAIDDQRQHLGGVIFPGLELQREALLAGTDDIRADELDNQVVTFPLSTNAAVSAGTLSAWRASIWGIRQQMLEKLPENTQTIITGGQHVLLDIGRDESISVIPELVMQGMNYLLQQEQ